MNLGKLKKQLVRDLRASPKKAAVLGVLALVAAWFWAPLVIKQFKKEGPTVQEATAGIAPLVASSADAASPPGQASPEPVIPAAPARPGWRELVERLSSDPRMVPAAASAPDVDPFRSLVAELSSNDEESVELAEQTATPPAQMNATPESLGLVLSGTLVGAQGGVAMINGRAYRAGQSIELAEGVAFVVVDVGHKQTVLERGGQRFELRAAPATGTGAIEIGPGR